MRVLIVGGLGYVGGRIADYLKNSDKKVSLVLSTTRNSYPAWAEDFTVVMMDLKKRSSINSCLNNFRPSVVIHLGALDQYTCQKDPALAYAVNVEGTRLLCEEAKKAGVKRLIYFSTFQVYGCAEGIITEKTPVMPLKDKVYPNTKHQAEECIVASGLDYTILRLSNAYGYPMDISVGQNVWTLVFNAFILNCIRNQAVAPRDRAWRDYIALSDVARAVEHVLFSDEKFFSNEVFNLGGEKTLSVIDVAEKIADIYSCLYKRQAQIVYPPMQDFKKFEYKIDKLKNTGFNLTEDMNNEIEKLFHVAQEMVNQNG